MSLLDLWHASTAGTKWSEIDLTEELRVINTLAAPPRIPEDHLIFRIFRAFPDPAKQIKVVLLGQDPYPEMLQIPVTDGEEDETQAVSRACGFSFSSPLGNNLPFSLRIMIAEILRSFPQPLVERVSARAGAKPLPPRVAVASDYSGDLSYLVADGVFLLNTFLTIAVDPKSERGNGKPKSHESWVTFTTQVLNFIRRTCPKVVYLALGKQAADLLKASGITDAIETDHPAKARYGGRNPFAGSNIFIQTNALLEKRGLRAIDWIPMKKAIDIKYFDASAVETVADIIEEVEPAATVLPLIFGISVTDQGKIDDMSDDSEDSTEG